MPLRFFESAVENSLAQMPNEEFRERQQASIDELWEVTTNRYTIKEQKEIGSLEYNDVEVWIGNAIGESTRGEANGDDFKRLTFRSINHVVERGRYYQFDNNTWITRFTDRYDSLDVTTLVRRCNNVMRIIDPENGSIFTIPCVVEYEMTAPNVQVTSSILTPNNHAKVKVQGNEMTHRLFVYNTRYILDGRPFKLLAFQNALNDETIADYDTLLELDLYLDEEHSGDDIENRIADNGTYDYQIAIDSANMELLNGATGTLNSSVTLNGKEVKREVVWSSSDSAVVEIDEQGNYTVVGAEGQKADIEVTLKGNDKVKAVITIGVVSAESLKAKVVVNPTFDKIRQYETIGLDVKATYGAKEYQPDYVAISLAKDQEQLDNRYISIQKGEKGFAITGKSIAPEKQVLYIRAKNAEPEFEAEYEMPVSVVSMLG